MNRAQLGTGAALALLVGITAVNDGLRAAVRPSVPSAMTTSAAATRAATPQPALGGLIRSDEAAGGQPYERAGPGGPSSGAGTTTATSATTPTSTRLR